MMALWGVEKRGLSVLFVDDEAISRMNDLYLKGHGPTNVICFSYLHDPYMDVLGDMVVSVERVQIEAKAASVPFYERLFQVLVHGFLHIVGFDDREQGERRRMERREKRLMKWVSSHDLFRSLVGPP